MSSWSVLLAGAALLLLMVVPFVSAQGEATDTACVYKVGDKYFDLRAISSSDAIVTQNEFYNLQLNPCNPITISNGGTTCPAGTLNCQLNQGNNAPAYLIADEISFNQMTYDGTTLSILYTGGAYCPNLQTYRQATIKFTCGTTTGAPIYGSETACAHSLTWTSSAACALDSMPGGDTGGPGTGGGSGGLSGGDVFLIIFFCGGFLYVVIGIAYNYRFRELRGFEMVPNVDFWRGLPSLIKDGCVFAWQKITGICTRN